MNINSNLNTFFCISKLIHHLALSTCRIRKRSIVSFIPFQPSFTGHVNDINDSISTQGMHLPSSINYKSDNIEPAFVSASILYRSCFHPFSRGFIGGHERFHRLVEPGIFSFSFLFFSSFYFFRFWNGSLVHLLRIDVHRGGDPAA